MGKQVVALMLGVKKQELDAELHDDESGEWIWEDCPRSKEMPKTPRTAYEGAVGYKIACSAPDSDEDNLAPYEEAIAVVDLKDRFAARIEEARVAWDTFATWLWKTHNKHLPAPRLLLALDERA